MSEEKKDKNRWVDAVTRMIELTQQGKMRWDTVEPQGALAQDENRISPVFQTIYNGKGLRVYHKKVRVKSLGTGLVAYAPSIKSKPLFRRVGVLEFVNNEGAPLWKFPHVDALADLVTAVEYQVAGVNEFLNDLFSETNAAA
ncbi:MAG: hypothetical protein ABR577_13015 [Pyrinomonadaceae bacterium]